VEWFRRHLDALRDFLRRHRDDQIVTVCPGALLRTLDAIHLATA
jgi:hypothetical protein